MLMVVAAPKALTVLAVVLSRSKLAEPVRILVVNVGLVPNTTTPVPVSLVIELAMLADVMLVVS